MANRSHARDEGAEATGRRAGEERGQPPPVGGTREQQFGSPAPGDGQDPAAAIITRGAAHQEPGTHEAVDEPGEVGPGAEHQEAKFILAYPRPAALGDLEDGVLLGRQGDGGERVSGGVHDEVVEAPEFQDERSLDRDPLGAEAEGAKECVTRPLPATPPPRRTRSHIG